MRRLCLFLFCFLLSSCVHTQTQSITPKGILSIQIPNERYASLLKDAWSKEYPQWKNHVEFVVKPYVFTQSFDTDIIWTNDIDIQYLHTLLVTFDNISYTYDLEKSMIRKEDRYQYVPIMTKGLLMVYNNKLEEVCDYEKIKGNFHYSHNMEYVFPFFADCFKSDNIVSINELINDEKLIRTLQDYKTMYEELKFSDNTLYNEVLLDNMDYGLYDSSLLFDNDEEDIGVQKKPTYKGNMYPSFMQTYGFAVRKECEDIAFANLFLSFVRSYEGLQAFIKSQYGVVLLQEESIKDFKIYDNTYKEMIRIMSTYDLYPNVFIQENPTYSLYKLWMQGNIAGYIQNYICGNKRAEDVAKDIQDEFLHLVYH